MKATFIIEMVARAAQSSLDSSGPAEPGWFEPGALRFVATSQDFTTVLLFLASFAVILVLSIATLNYVANRREKQRASLLAFVKYTTLKRVMITEFRSLAAGDSMGQAAQTVMHTLQHDFPVLEDERPVGSLSRSALFCALERQGPDALVRDVMPPPALEAEATETVSSALKRFHYTSAPALWVVENSKLVGLVTPDTLEQYLRVRAAERKDPKDASQASSHAEAQHGRAQHLV